MAAIPNILSLTRFFASFCFLSSDIHVRATAIAIAMITDVLDGFLARRFQLTSKFGALMDPIADKFFVFFVIATFIGEEQLTYFDACCLICRDFSVILYGIYLASRGALRSYRFQSIWCGKATTFLQFLVLLSLTFGLSIPASYYSVFLVLGICALGELTFFNHSQPMIHTNS